MIRFPWLLALGVLVWTATAAAQDTTSFAAPGHGYTLEYPSAWSQEAPGPFAVILRPPAVSAGGPVAVSVENVRQPDGSGLVEGGELLAARYRTELTENARQVDILREAPFLWNADGDMTMAGRQVVADFVRDDLPYRQWAVFLPNPAGPVVHVWLFTAPQTLFTEWRPTAEEILRSIRPSRQ